ncbi:hypothetical protein SARC_00896 [Sphaeroforma arctica JP610]|uniref:Conserved oligomeric Golgi complex subunit 8 n=1 Tax=Sphaeroforma arctica JP610 TaxID=667725 RepID=A0A0L0GD58_9EUKA|nr:hypothetical protein SARC_00896 [Sphaeroforma arctica JP610]KNC86945.1 hypothetical protein SARC_00896 [Sphaeroforma arctica JP610]|eukprot:XP_014160847.1 hypothetical protein SARC_00896 [Sphaeroforma arctica JP610]
MEGTELFTFLFPEKAKDGEVNNADHIAYLNELTGFSVDRLSHEPERLDQEQKRLVNDTRDLAFQHYRGFIQTAKCSKDVFLEFKQLANNIVRLQERLPLLTEQCHSFVRDTPSLTTKRHSLFATLQYHSQLLEILEVPQLMDTCVRNGHYEEALDLDNTVTRISRKHGAISLFAQVVDEVSEAKKVMLTQLMQLLRGDINLPACLRVVGHLRRMNCFTEKELRLKFLSARGLWLKTNVDALSDTDAYAYTNKYIETFRIGLFDIVTHYRAIFPDSGTRKGDLQSRQLMYGWVNHIVAAFMTMLKSQLPRVTEGTLINSLLGQCMYLGSSLGRVGVDFRGLLPELFCGRIITLFAQATSNTTNAFAKALKTKPRNVITSSAGAASLHRAAATSAETIEYTKGQPSNSNFEQPSAALNEFPYLATLVNGFVDAYNNLRHCAPLATANTIRRIVSEHLNNIVALVVFTHQNVFEAREDDDPEIVNQSLRFMQLLSTDAVPFIARGFHAIFANSQSSTAGSGRFSVADIDFKEIFAPLLAIEQASRTMTPPKESPQTTKKAAPAEPEDATVDETEKPSITYDENKPSTTSDENKVAKVGDIAIAMEDPSITQSTPIQDTIPNTDPTIVSTEPIEMTSPSAQNSLSEAVDTSPETAHHVPTEAIEETSAEDFRVWNDAARSDIPGDKRTRRSTISMIETSASASTN